VNTKRRENTWSADIGEKESNERKYVSYRNEDIRRVELQEKKIKEREMREREEREGKQ
jgi:hypothetical protein